MQGERDHRELVAPFTGGRDLQARDIAARSGPRLTRIGRPRIFWKRAGTASDAVFPVFLTPDELANVLRMSPRTLEKMRLANSGPRYIRLGGTRCGRVIYSVRDIEDWLEYCARGQLATR